MLIERPKSFGRAMEFLGDPEASELIEYIMNLEVHVERLETLIRDTILNEVKTK